MTGPKPETIIDQTQAANRVVLTPASAGAMAAELASYLTRAEAFAVRLEFDDEPAHFALAVAGGPRGTA